MSRTCLACGMVDPDHLMMACDTEFRLGGVGNARRFWICERAVPVMEGMLAFFRKHKTDPMYICGPMEVPDGRTDRSDV